MDFALKPSLAATQSAVQSASQNGLSAQLEIAQRLLAESDRKRAESDHELNLAKLKIQALVMELAHLKRMRFGQSSEAMSTPHGDLFSDAAALALEIENAATAVATAAATPAPQTPPTRPTRLGAGRQALPAHLPRIIHRHGLPENECNCDGCGRLLKRIGEDISEQLDVTPAQFFVHQHIRPQYACKVCETIKAEPVPAAVIDGGVAAPGLISWVLTSKFVDHLPLYRLVQIAARSGVNLSISTLASWVGIYGVALQPLVDRLRELLLLRAVLHADETPVEQLAPGNGKTQRAYLWAYCSSELQTQADVDVDGDINTQACPIVVFDYQAGRAGAHARAFLDGWSGHLMVDDYVGYKALFAAKPGESSPIIELGCMAHARRKYFELHAANGSPIALEALNRIAGLYAIEQRARTMTVNERQRLRQQEATPKLDLMKAWLVETRGRTANGGALARAIDYSLRRWQALARYAQSGELPIDNNPIENAIRPIAIGKKNWLFTGSERAGKRAAAIQSLFATAKRNQLNPAAWLTDVIEKLPTWPNKRIDELLPFAGYQFG